MFVKEVESDEDDEEVVLLLIGVRFFDRHAAYVACFSNLSDLLLSLEEEIEVEGEEA